MSISSSSSSSSTCLPKEGSTSSSSSHHPHPFRKKSSKDFVMDHHDLQPVIFSYLSKEERVVAHCSLINYISKRIKFCDWSIQRFQKDLDIFNEKSEKVRAEMNRHISLSLCYTSVGTDLNLLRMQSHALFDKLYHTQHHLDNVINERAITLLQHNKRLAKIQAEPIDDPYALASTIFSSST